MAREVIDANNRQYIVNFDEDLPVAKRIWALIKISLVDELTGAALSTPARLTADRPNFKTRVGAQGGGVVGVPFDVLSTLNINPYPTQLSVEAHGYLADTRNVIIPANPFFPGTFQPLNAGDWPLHRRPVALFGRVTLQSGTGLAPVVGAQVSITKIWRKVPPAVVPPPDPFPPVSLQPDIYAARPVGATLRRQLFVAVPPTFLLLARQNAGDVSLVISNTVGLGPGSVLAFDRMVPERAEYVSIASISGSLTPTQPATVRLNFPLFYPHTGVELVTPLALGVGNNLGVEAIREDTVVLANSLAGIASADLVEISGGGPAAEYHQLFTFHAVTDARGAYRLPPLSRVARLELVANDGIHAPLPQIVYPDYRQEVNLVDFTLQ
jgi:hypothetical protein